MGEFEVLKRLDVCVPNQEVSMLLSPALLKRPVLTTLDTPTFHHPNTQNYRFQGYVTSSVHKHQLHMSFTQLTYKSKGKEPHLVVMTMISTICSHTIRQKSTKVFGKGPEEHKICQAM